MRALAETPLVDVPGCRVLVTAATGNVGREVVRRLRAPNVSMRIAGRAAKLEDDPAGMGTTRDDAEVELDFTRPDTFDEAVRGCDAVFLLRPPAIANMRVTLNRFVDRAVASGVRHIVFVSVAGAENNRWIPHRAVEDHLQASPVGWTILRPGFFANNLGDAYRRDIVEDGRIYVPAGEGRVAFIDAEDIAAVAVEALLVPRAHAGKAYWLTGPHALSFAQAAQVLTEELCRPVRYEAASVARYAWHLKTRRALPAAQIVVQSILHRGLRAGAAEQVSAQLEALLGRPARTLRDYVRAHRALWQELPAPFEYGQAALGSSR